MEVDAYRSARQFGARMILLTMIFRLFETGLPRQLITHLSPQKETEETKTGQMIVRSFPAQWTLPFPEMDELAEETVCSFCPEDAQLVTLVNSGKEQPDPEALIAAPLELDLAQDTPTVLILHTHTCESYTPGGEAYTEFASYRTLDGEHNMLAVGEHLAKKLECAGIRVVHDRELHDYPSYTGAYNHARGAIRAALEENPGIQLVLDLHRDAIEIGSGQYRTTAAIGNQTGAQLMFVMGSGNAGLKHPKWEENLALALKLQCLLERQCPGICRPISLRPQRYNQDLRPGALLVEVGSAGNTLEEALLAADQLGEAIVKLKNGTNAAAERGQEVRYKPEISFHFSSPHI